MTREEAIRRIKEHIIHHHMGEYPHIFIGEALEMAIAALREQDDHFREATKKMGWISVEEMLPERKTEALCFSKNAGVFIGTDWVDWPDGKIMFHLGTSYDWPYATHWMPLPEPPEVEV